MRLYYDFASTLCYVAHRVLSGVEDKIEEIGVELEWRPIDLTMAAPWNRGDSFAEDVRTAVRNTARALDVDVEMPDPWLDSRPAALVALSTPDDAAERRWRRAVFETFFERRVPTMTPELTELAREVAGFELIPEGETAYGIVEESTREAFGLGVTGVPAIVLHNWLFGGIYDGDSMVAVLRQLSQQYRDLGATIVN